MKSMPSPGGVRRPTAGFGLIETIVGTVVFTIIAFGIYQGYQTVSDVVRLSRQKVAAIALGTEQLEVIRSLPYADVGVVGGLPRGVIPRTQTFERVSATFTVTTTIRNIDDPFDGTIGGNPADASPADYKLAELEIACPLCWRLQPVTVTTTVAPRGLETASGNGALFIRVFDANGQPVPGASVHVENTQGEPAIVIDDTTNTDGVLIIVDAPPGVEAYAITVTKAGYSTDRTYPPRAPSNPNPTKPHATVVRQAVTQVSFAIDRLSTLAVTSSRDTCVSVDSVTFILRGSKLIGTNPDVRKYEQTLTTDSDGRKTIADLEWDEYAVELASVSYDLVGAIPLLPLAVAPGSARDLRLVVAPKEPRTLLVTVKDAGTKLPLNDVSVTLETLSGVHTRLTGQGALRQTDWSGGAGQEDFLDPKRYAADDGNIANGSTGPQAAGELTLRKTAGRYQPSGWLESSTFDTGESVNLGQILWSPLDQPPDVGSDSMRFRVATNKNRQAAWNFVGPDGTPNTYYTLSENSIHVRHRGDRYFRYRVFLQTADRRFTPNLSEVAFVFSSQCVPPGQGSFTGLGTGSATLTVSRSGYATFTDEVTISDPWQQREVLLNPS